MLDIHNGNIANGQKNIFSLSFETCKALLKEYFYENYNFIDNRNFTIDITTDVWKFDGSNIVLDKVYDIAGPLCFAGDYLAHGIQLPAVLQEGQYLFIDHTGANTYALWSRHCSRTLPATWAWDGNSMVKWSNRLTIGF